MPNQRRTQKCQGQLTKSQHFSCTVNFKTYTNSIWHKKCCFNPPEKQSVFYNTHPAIISQEVSDKVQEIRQQRHRRDRTDKSVFRSGLLHGLWREDVLLRSYQWGMTFSVVPPTRRILKNAILLTISGQLFWSSWSGNTCKW